MSKYDFELDMSTENSVSMIINMLKKEAKILEVGPATGRMTRYLSEKMNCTVDIIEIDRKAGKRASGYCRKACIGIRNGDVEKRIWEDVLQGEKYDFIVFADVLEHLHNPENVLLRMNNYLNSTGKIILSVPNIAHNAVIVKLLEDEFEYREVGLLDNTHIHFFTHKSLKNMITRCGYVCERELATYADIDKTELGANLDNVSDELGKYLLARQFGNVYQFIWQISKAD